MRRVAMYLRVHLIVAMIVYQAQSLRYSETLYQMEVGSCVLAMDMSIHVTCHPGLRPTECERHIEEKATPHGKFGPRHDYHWDQNGTEVALGLPAHLTRVWYFINVTCTNVARYCDYHIMMSSDVCRSSADDLRFVVVLPSKVLAFEGDYVDVLCRAEAEGKSVPVSWYKDNVLLHHENRHLGSAAAEGPVKFHGDWKILNPNLAASRLHENLRTLPDGLYIFENNGSSLLLLPQLRRSDVGRYTCAATDGTQVIRNTTLLGLARHLTFTELPLSEIYINETEDLNLTCLAEGIPKPEVYWTFDGRVVNEVINVTSAGGHGVTLLLFHVLRSSADGLYECHAENGLEEITMTVQVHVNSIPPMPLVQLHVGQPWNASRVPIVVAWQLPNDTDISHVPVLVVHMALLKKTGGDIRSPDYKFSADSHQLRADVDTATNYTLVVWLVNAMGHGPAVLVPFTTPSGTTDQETASQTGTVSERNYIPAIVVGTFVGCFVVAMIILLIVALWRHSRRHMTLFQRHSRYRTESETEICETDEPIAIGNGRMGFANPLYEDKDSD